MLIRGQYWRAQALPAKAEQSNVTACLPPGIRSAPYLHRMQA
jgi:hypothetical protein